MKRKKLLALSATILYTQIIVSFAMAEVKPVELDKEIYPYAPSLLKYEKSSESFNSPEVCMDCHSDKYEEWQGSVHALAFKDPIYQGELNAAIKAVGQKIAKHCEACHSTAAVAEGKIKGIGLKGQDEITLAGVSCDVCHSVKGHRHWQTPTHQPENCSLILSPAKEKDGEAVLTKYGPFKPDDECGEGFHGCVESSLHTSAELCASCHQVYNYQTHTPIEATYLEWKNGPYSSNQIQCQDCHMVEIETFKRVADSLEKPLKKEYRHYFNGANYLLYYLTELAAKKAGDKELAANVHQKYEMAIQRLQAAAELEVSPVYHGGSLSEIKVRIHNRRAGHSLPTSLTNVRQMWLEVTATDSEGNVLVQSGKVDKKGVLAENTRLFNSNGQTEHYKFTLDPWELQSFSKHDTIPPKGYKDAYYGLTAGKGDAVSVDVKLRFRQADQKTAEKILGLVPDDIHLDAVYGLKKVPLLPIVDMAVGQHTFKLKQ